MIDPIAAMYAALEAIADGKAGEVELEWSEMTEDGDTRLTITVRRDVKHFRLPTGGPG
jgi:hypothetical protein